MVGVIEEQTKRPQRALTRRERLWVGLGAAVVFAVELIALGVPSFWYDETATYASASRSWGGLWAMLGNIDAVHGLFYSLMHPLAHLSGPDTFALRVPSALAVALTSAGVYALTRRFGPPLSAAAAGLIFVSLARTSSIATEARSFALATLIATALALILLCAHRAGRSRSVVWLIAYVVLAVIGIYLYVYLILVVAAHAVTAVWARPTRRRILEVLASLATVGVLCVPLLLAVTSQRTQLGGTFPVTVDTWTYVFFSQFFEQQWLQALVLWLLLAAAVGVLIVRRRRARRMTDTPVRDATGPASPSLSALTLPWLVLPTAVVVAFSALSPTIYQPRALVISAPALCILVAELTRRAFGSRVALAGALVVALLGVGPFVAARQLTAQGEDWPVVADYLTEHATSGDGVVYSEPVDYHSWPSLMRIMHPSAVGDLVDVTLVRPYTELSELFDQRTSLQDAQARLVDLDRVWYVRSAIASPTATRADAAILQSAGFTLTDTWSGPRTDVDEWVRTAE